MHDGDDGDDGHDGRDGHAGCDGRGGPDRATHAAWAALELPGPPPGHAPRAPLPRGQQATAESITYGAAPGVFPSRLPVRELARATVGVCSLAAAELRSQRCGTALPAVRVDEAAVAAAFASERLVRTDGHAPTSFAPLSGFWRTADGWVRTHANYPHHRARLLTALGIPDTDDTAATARLTAELRNRRAHEIQETVYAAGGLAVAVAPGPVPAHTARPLAEVRTATEGTRPPLPAARLPADGVRVLDLTRVLAGPVATRTLALLGADVLRIDPPRLPEDPGLLADTGLGKRSALLDLAAAEDRRRFATLLAAADVVVLGYRPGALDAHGLAPGDLLHRHPGLVVAQVCAWGWSGPWAGRRGFDSLVQAATGVAAAEAGPDGHPGVLPAQALDHGTGYLLAAGVLRALGARQRDGCGRHLRFSLAGTAGLLLHGIGAGATGPEVADDSDDSAGSDGSPGFPGPPDPAPWLTEVPSAYGTLRHVLPPVHYEGAPQTWSRPSGRWGADRPAWL